MTDLNDLPRRGCRRARNLLWLAAIPLLSVTACDGDTLYDPREDVDDEEDPVAGPEDPEEMDLSVSVEMDADDRAELTDTLFVQVEGSDQEGEIGITNVGFSVVIRDTEDDEERARTDHETVAASAGETASATFPVLPDWLGPDDLPADLRLEVHGWVEADDGECAAAALDGEDEGTSSCTDRTVDGTELVVADTEAEEAELLVVRGRTTSFRSSSVVAGDLQVDTLRERAFVSDRDSNYLHVLDPESFEWQDDVSVGSEPWGLHMNRTGDTLLVANSGGTSISRVALDGEPAEVVPERLQTRNTPLFELHDEDIVVNRVDILNFSDRPQFVAQDAEGRVLYSTRPTEQNPQGTIRVIEHEDGWEEPHSQVLYRLPDDLVRASGEEDTLDVTVTDTLPVAVGNVDSIRGFTDGSIEIFDHPPGHPSETISSGRQLPLDALRFMRDSTDSDIRFLDPEDHWRSVWMLDNVSFADTTHAATSGDREHVAFGDGGEASVGRVTIWNAEEGTISNRVTVEDLVNNASERVRALELNDDGSLGAARGAFGTYFFSNDLRLRGTAPEMETGGGGVALHPDHPDTPAPSASDETTVAFTMTEDGAVRVLDTVHYTERARIPVRDGLTGPFQVTPPLPSDNDGQGRDCTGDDCVVAKVFAVTGDDGLLVVDVLASDIEGEGS